VVTERRAVAMVAGVAVLWGSVGVVVRQIDLSAVALVSGRIWLASPALVLFVRRTERERAWSWRPSRLLVLNGCILAAHWVSVIAALQRAPIGTVLLITYLAPVGIAALAPATLGEVVPARTKVALGVAVTGIALIAAPALDGGGGSGILLALLTGTLYVPLALLNKSLSDSIGGAELALWQLLIAGAVLLPFALVADWGGVSGDWPWLLVLALVYTAFAFGAYLTALAAIPATRAAVLLYLEPASAVGFGWVLLHERPTPSMVIGGALVVAAGLVAARTPAAPELPPIVAEAADAAG
jgi:drug/metabolite transporter (DMT)-like permease